MASDAQRYLAKSRESLASAQADLDAGRCNSAANRAYYGAFQAAVAMLTMYGIRPLRGSWEHKFVISQFSGKLVWRRKLVSPRFRGLLERLLEVRVKADYQPIPVSRRDARKAAREAGALLGEADRLIKGGKNGG